MLQNKLIREILILGGKSAKEIAEMQRRNRQEASAGKGENDANVAPWNYKKEKDEIKY